MMIYRYSFNYNKQILYKAFSRLVHNYRANCDQEIEYKLLVKFPEDNLEKMIPVIVICKPKVVMFPVQIMSNDSRVFTSMIVNIVAGVSAFLI